MKPTILKRTINMNDTSTTVNSQRLSMKATVPKRTINEGYYIETHYQYEGYMYYGKQSTACVAPL